ncbi:centrosomal protein of 63 kDa-like isoform X2 [Actinia tenebrosa]|uniref:Centrosomal protein of 63 kDa-like isoform X2 n=1 Tax=Actinia tenebrosa TaxID=6105 RepID=A0A6P8IFQ7_ACTTE|nr:centrosomal protein of 63 kDa-like isoform X2 [Actinia tenebrosa]
MEIESLTGIFAGSLGLKGNLTSCEHELKELMRQIDLMVTAKKAEWENHMHAVQIQLEKRNKEVGFVRAQLEQKNQEVEKLQYRVDEMEMNQRDGISEYEQQVMHLKEEVDNLKYEHEKIQKKSEKQVLQGEKEKEQLVLDLNARDAEVQRLKERLEEYKLKVLEWEGARHAWEERIRGLENQKKTLLEKSDMTQQQLLGYQNQLNKRRNILDNMEHSRQREIRDLEAQLERIKEESESKEDTITELKDSLDSALSASKQQASEIAQLQEDLRVALDALQQLEDEKAHVLEELHSRDHLIQAAEVDQLKHADDIMKLEQSLTLKDEVIRKFEGATTRTENMELRRLKEDLRTSRIEMQSHIDSEAFLKEQLEHTTQKLETSNKTNAKLQAQLKRKEEELRKITEDDFQHLTAERNKLQEKLYSLEEGHAGALNGMKSEVDNLALQLHKRDTSMADVSEKLQRMEKELREATNRYDRCGAELQVTNAQLDALRIENKHLRDAARDQLDISEVYQGNMEFIAQLEADNRVLRMEVVSLREQLSAVEVNQQDKLRSALKKSQHTLDDIKQNEFRRHSELQTESERKIAALEARLESTIRIYETQLHFTQSENERLKMNQSKGKVYQQASAYTSLPNGTSVLPEYVPKRQPQDISHTSVSDYTDTEALTYADLGGAAIVSESERSATPRGSRRTSLTADFVAEENRRERELERILDGRIEDLKTNTDYIIHKYS